MFVPKQLYCYNIIRHIQSHNNCPIRIVCIVPANGRLTRGRCLGTCVYCKNNFVIIELITFFFFSFCIIVQWHNAIVYWTTLGWLNLGMWQGFRCILRLLLLLLIIVISIGSMSSTLFFSTSIKIVTKFKLLLLVLKS